MADQYRSLLKEGHRELTSLYADTKTPVQFRQDWQQPVFARRSLGDDVQVTAWQLAEYFLLSWTDWEVLLSRYLRYFGQTWSDVPASWRQLKDQCKALSSRVAVDGKLSQLLARSWTELPPKDMQARQARERLADRVAHELIVNHRRQELLGLLSEQREPERQERSSPAPSEQPWRVCQEVVARYDDTLGTRWREANWHNKVEMGNQLKCYQRMSLLATWLSDGSQDGSDHRGSALVTILQKEMPMLNWIDTVMNDLRCDNPVRQLVQRVLTRIATAVSDFSYDEFVEDISAETFRPDEDSPLGSGEINLIPSNDNGACRSILVAVSKGDKKAIGFQNVMRQVREHLIECWEQTRIVLVLCDHWSKSMLDEHIRDVQAHHRRGVQFVFLMASSPGNVLAPIRLDLSKAA